MQLQTKVRRLVVRLGAGHLVRSPLHNRPLHSSQLVAVATEEVGLGAPELLVLLVQHHEAPQRVKGEAHEGEPLDHEQRGESPRPQLAPTVQVDVGVDQPDHQEAGERKYGGGPGTDDVDQRLGHALLQVGVSYALALPGGRSLGHRPAGPGFVVRYQGHDPQEQHRDAQNDHVYDVAVTTVDGDPHQGLEVVADAGFRQNGENRDEKG